MKKLKLFLLTPVMVLADGSLLNEMKNDIGVWVEGDALFWQSTIDNVYYGVEDHQVKSPHFDWDVGFRLSVGYKLPRDSWDLLFTYTQVSATGSGEAKHGTIFPAFGTDFVERASCHVNSHVHMIDLEVGRWTHVGKYLELRPLLGLRTLFIDEHTHITYQGGNVLPLGFKDLIHTQQNFWGIGLRLGVDSLWTIGRGWGIYGNGSLSLLSSHSKWKLTEKQKPVNLQGIQWRQDVDPLVVAADLALGLQWDYLFSQDRYHFGVKLGWEFNVFFDQNQRLRWVGESSPGVVMNEQGDLSFQGITLGFRFDF